MKCCSCHYWLGVRGKPWLWAFWGEWMTGSCQRVDPLTDAALSFPSRLQILSEALSTNTLPSHHSNSHRTPLSQSPNLPFVLSPFPLLHPTGVPLRCRRKNNFSPLQSIGPFAAVRHHSGWASFTRLWFFCAVSINDSVLAINSELRSEPGLHSFNTVELSCSYCIRQVRSCCNSVMNIVLQGEIWELHVPPLEWYQYNVVFTALLLLVGLKISARFVGGLPWHWFCVHFFFFYFTFIQHDTYAQFLPKALQHYSWNPISCIM